MVDVISALALNMPDPTGVWENLLFNVFEFVGNYGWRIVVFTIFLKLILSPLDIFQRVMMRRNQKIQERIKPEMDKLQAQFGSNKQVLSQKQMQLNKREGMSYFSTCLPMIVTLVIFFWLFSGMTSMSQYMTMRQYLQMYDKYESVYSQEIDGGKSDSAAMEIAQEAVLKAYNEEYKVSFLWIKNIWSPDVPWRTAVLDYAGFMSAIGGENGDLYKKPEKTGLSQAELGTVIGQYDKVTAKLVADPANKVNGWLLLPILSVGLSFLSQFIMTRQQKKSGQAAVQGTTAASSMKIMMFAMPLMMGFFALSYTSVFTLYIITNSAMTLLINLSSTGVLKLLDKRNKGGYVLKKAGKDSSFSGSDTIIRYGRPDPNATAEVKDDKKKKK